MSRGEIEHSRGIVRRTNIFRGGVNIILKVILNIIGTSSNDSRSTEINKLPVIKKDKHSSNKKIKTNGIKTRFNRNKCCKRLPP